MTREKYESLPLATLKELAKARKMKGVSTLKKADLIEAMISLDEQEDQEKLSEQKESSQEHLKEMQNQNREEKAASELKENKEHREAKDKKPETDMEQLDSGCSVSGILEVMPDGFGFIRSDNYLPGENDVYVSPAQIRRFGLKTGDILSGNTRIKTQSEKFSALLYVTTVNGYHPAEAAKRPNFEELTPIFQNPSGTAGKQYGDADYGFDFADRKRSERDDRFSAESGKNNSFKRSCAFGTENRTGHAPSYITDR